MLKEMLTGKINFEKSVSDWKEAIETAAQPLLLENYISQSYIDAMIQNVIEFGPYIVIMPNLAIPHAQTGAGVFKNGLALLNLEQPVIFPDNSTVKLLIVLAARDSDTHMEVISELTDIIMDDEIMDTIFKAQAADQILECFL